MNPKFKELMEIASSGACYDNPTNTLVGTEIELFARYIVQECVDICEAHPSKFISNNWNGDAVASDIVSKLQEHFGLE